MVDSPLLAHLIGALFCVQYEANIFYGMGFVNTLANPNFLGLSYTITYDQIGFGRTMVVKLRFES